MVLLTPDDIDNFRPKMKRVLFKVMSLHSPHRTGRNDIEKPRLELQQARERGEVEFNEYVNDEQELWRLFIGFTEMRDLA
ncbi:hypothetical protein PsorP6_005748 [Peronosclerospora sorghi]|uniref:Uncharacterized protein n=1 Tax=Peronosclerospora sorghi TaxID=230839 RepID=A0ACC0W1M6_9STRA|nr:hypothetical protein PsorP6_005748 [Peronosclerospora sorghi]